MDVPLDPPIERTFVEYAENYFNLNRKGVLRKRTTIEKITHFKTVCSCVDVPHLSCP